MSIPRVPIYIFGILRHHVIMIHIHFLWSLLIQISFKTSVALLFLIGALRFHGPTMALPLNKETRFTITGKCTKTLNPFVSRYYTVLCCLVHCAVRPGCLLRISRVGTAIKCKCKKEDESFCPDGGRASLWKYGFTIEVL